jgi:hypothetical protein
MARRFFAAILGVHHVAVLVCRFGLMRQPLLIPTM